MGKPQIRDFAQSAEARTQHDPTWRIKMAKHKLVRDARSDTEIRRSFVSIDPLPINEHLNTARKRHSKAMAELQGSRCDVTQQFLAWLLSTCVFDC